MADTDYYLQRAKHEAILAIQADHPATAASHQGLSVRYSARAVLKSWMSRIRPRSVFGIVAW
jgi:hypothetical protein